LVLAFLAGLQAGQASFARLAAAAGTAAPPPSAAGEKSGARLVEAPFLRVDAAACLGGVATAVESGLRQAPSRAASGLSSTVAGDPRRGLEGILVGVLSSPRPFLVPPSAEGVHNVDAGDALPIMLQGLQSFTPSVSFTPDSSLQLEPGDHALAAGDLLS
jgi:hypothetical protein